MVAKSWEGQQDRWICNQGLLWRALFQKKWKIRQMTTKFLCQYFIDEFRDDQKMSLGTFARKITKAFNVTPNRWKLELQP